MKIELNYEKWHTIDRYAYGPNVSLCQLSIERNMDKRSQKMKARALSPTSWHYQSQV
jgi:hypothetical protein